MKIKITFLFCAILISHVAIAKESFKKVYSGKIPTKDNYRINLEIPKEWSDPGLYTKVTIYQSKKLVFSLADLQASNLENVGEFPKGTKKIGKYLRIFPLGSKSVSQFLLAMSNWVGGSNDDEIILVSISTKIPKVAFRESIKITAIKDFDGDGYYDLLKAGGRGEPTADNNYSYDPYLVYRQIRSSNDIEFKTDETLSKKWTTENNFYWHGMKYDEKIRVDKKGELVRKK